MSVVDYNSHQLDFYSDDNKCHLFLRDVRLTPIGLQALGLRYTEVGDAGYTHPIVVAGLHYLDTNRFVSSVGCVGWSFMK